MLFEYKCFRECETRFLKTQIDTQPPTKHAIEFSRKDGFTEVFFSPALRAKTLSILMINGDSLSKGVLTRPPYNKTWASVAGTSENLKYYTAQEQYR